MGVGEARDGGEEGCGPEKGARKGTSRPCQDVHAWQRKRRTYGERCVCGAGHSSTICPYGSCMCYLLHTPPAAAAQCRCRQTGFKCCCPTHPYTPLVPPWIHCLAPHPVACGHGLGRVCAHAQQAQADVAAAAAPQQQRHSSSANAGSKHISMKATGQHSTLFTLQACQQGIVTGLVTSSTHPAFMLLRPVLNSFACLLPTYGPLLNPSPCPCIPRYPLPTHTLPHTHTPSHLSAVPNMVDPPSMCSPNPPSSFWWLVR